MVKKASFSAEYRLLCKLLYDARMKAGLTQDDVAKRLNRPQSYVSKYESGERRLDVIEFVRVATVLKVAPEELVKRLA
jgi:transcriptional regulator with XRE-family HTH domain